MRQRNSFFGSLLYQIAFVLLILWAIAFLGYNIGDYVHILLAIALVLILIRVIRNF
jgi:hypothetical protein